MRFAFLSLLGTVFAASNCLAAPVKQANVTVYTDFEVGHYNYYSESQDMQLWAKRVSGSVDICKEDLCLKMYFLNDLNPLLLPQANFPFGTGCLIWANTTYDGVDDQSSQLSANWGEVAVPLYCDKKCTDKDFARYCNYRCGGGGEYPFPENFYSYRMTKEQLLAALQGSLPK
ncbi:hypothetical protein K493DRAFT_335274 [Basidiobolus meristosporus CBS 931.73]|uniref:Uncharacterized protein n=1 Tax=Basidiobolus meristosporus CBS 931.73 TaxID=1314790 RepID=A0A1Y1YRR8_9FUNG|nr:hypothetical protein K493DRAFT_335274 [Basidiobolus meristosporus CBS 931.73]|eukprot:ORY00723.1 hypothetical protein K493DRAFT_335274 [Basidiobolus meristosporus CBS 931.73]